MRRTAPLLCERGFIVSRDVQRQDGFTLVEIMVVVVILGVLVGIAIPIFLSQRAEAQRTVVHGDLRNARTAQEAAFAVHEAYAADAADLIDAGFAGSAGVGLGIAVDAGAYCLAAAHDGLAGEIWYAGSAGGPSLVPAEACGAVAPPAVP